jgi:hypothetical protein
MAKLKWLGRDIMDTCDYVWSEVHELHNNKSLSVFEPNMYVYMVIIFNLNPLPPKKMFSS